jgi:histidinol-phosphatase (PHP family)
MIDLHIHTKRCHHAVGEPAEYVAAARAAGITTMAFTDHLPLPPEYDGDWDYAMPPSELADYVADVRDMQRLAAAEGGPEVLLGIEADWMSGREVALAEELPAHPWDVVLGSVHFQGDWAFDDPRLTDEYKRREIDQVWRRYFDDLAASARTGLFDVIGHADLVKKFGFYPDGDLTPYYRTAVDAMAEAGVAFECNASGLRKPVAEIYPSLEFMRIARDAGIAATMGSDAHAPSEVGAGLGQARDALLTSGFTSVLVFRGRVPEEVAL